MPCRLERIQKLGTGTWAFSSFSRGWGLAQAFTTFKIGCPALLAFFARGRGLQMTSDSSPDPKNKNQVFGTPRSLRAAADPLPRLPAPRIASAVEAGDCDNPLLFSS
jgi:hypothetical protein